MYAALHASAVRVLRARADVPQPWLMKMNCPLQCKLCEDARYTTQYKLVGRPAAAPYRLSFSLSLGIRSAALDVQQVLTDIIYTSAH